jgi:hypothetical protein
MVDEGGGFVQRGLSGSMTGITCPACGNQNAARIDTCAKCGASLTAGTSQSRTRQYVILAAILLVAFSPWLLIVFNVPRFWLDDVMVIAVPGVMIAWVIFRAPWRRRA